MKKVISYIQDILVLEKANLLNYNKSDTNALWEEAYLKILLLETYIKFDFSNLKRNIKSIKATSQYFYQQELPIKNKNEIDIYLSFIDKIDENISYLNYRLSMPCSK